MLTFRAICWPALLPLTSQGREAEMTDQQFQLVLRHLQVMIAILGLMAGVMLAFAWEYLG
jgi:hypothetical protein